MLLSIHVLLLLAASLGMVTSMATVATTMAMSLALFDLVGAKSSPWDWQKGTGEYAKYVSSIFFKMRTCFGSRTIWHKKICQPYN